MKNKQTDSPVISKFYFDKIYSFATHKDEVYLAGETPEKHQIIAVFKTLDVLEWLDIAQMKKTLIKHINDLK